MSQDWWRGGVIYQIYPRSYQDSTGNGQGDLNGITQRLDHIASLGVDSVWISPFFKSPMKDFGYDVSDYRAIDPCFGTLDDFDALLARAHELGLKIMIDLVLSHTSDQHDWFAQSRQSHDNAKSDWYVWADPKPDGTPPNNWLSIFGGSAWQWEPKREQYYLHNFLTSQPDLNFHNTDVQDALLDVVKFWLDRGVDGFRLDTINFYFHDQKLRDNPALSPDERNASIAPAVNPYNHQNHLYDKNQPENLLFLERLRRLMDKYDDRTIVGEVGDAQCGLDIVAQYTKPGRVHMCYAFDFLSPEPLSAQKTQNILSDFANKAPDGWPCWALSNHDVVRHATRLSTTAGRKQYQMQGALLLSMEGSACIYQGEELGLPEADVPFEALQDPYGITFWPEFKGRDGCRTPMVWDDSAQAGFSSADKTWLPIDPQHLKMTVAHQEEQNDSLLHFYRQFLAFRKSHTALVSGKTTALNATPSVLHFIRIGDSGDIFCAFNFTDEPQTIPFEQAGDVLTASGFTPQLANGALTIAPHAAAFIALKGNS
ncbi:alpha-glucosidase [Amylibacter kogurei]|uniref:Alpha-glucosidase n=1 Tax=Paramylibacter kogurei TaxID=1889778 RepID=A0A2G5K878_9RHOB|nr:alpha-amylase family glycosyl hydrolase [Amylibacter kogurei]PIB25222.1 alpha-glucosidase [Amylibacter kogurei]